MSDTDEKYNISEIFDSLNNALSLTTRVVLSDEYTNAFSRIAEIAESLPAVSSAIVDYQKQVEQRVRELMPAIRAADEYARIMSEQLLSTYKALSFGTTELIERIQKASIELNFSAYINALANTLQSSQIVAQDFWYIKESASIQSLSREISFPRGFSTALRETNKSSAERIAPQKDICYDFSKRGFVYVSNPDAITFPREINCLCSGADLFDSYEDEFISILELMDFENFLFETNSFAITHPVGIKILTFLQKYVKRINFDAPIYYHSRAMDRESPYVNAEMLTAPSGYTGAGRFNYPGQSFYYFSNAKEGAISEVRKHNPMKRIQTAAVSPVQSIEMIDLSGKLRKGQNFLQHIRFPADLSIRFPKEYLLPCFVSDCCRYLGIGGIKYYGTASYSNYVCWNTGYFKFLNWEKIEEVQK